ncbi:hypothetical protein FACS1894216_11450 [Synergistales bacterium]|nr:hypothetical protein FACS1894216_11450 [Synergistales bacterium]
MNTDDADERAQAVMDAIPFMISMWDRDEIAGCNMEALRVFGLSERFEYIERFYEMSPEFQPNGEPSAKMIARMNKAALRDGSARFEWVYKLPGGKLLPAEVTLTRVTWKDTYRIVSCARDLRVSKAQEGKIRAADERNMAIEAESRAVQAASEAKSAFLARMSHEIRTPMNAIIGMTDLIRTDNLDATQTQYFSDIQKMSVFLLQIINDILDFSKIEAGKMELLPANYSIRELYDNICSLARFTISGKPLAFLADIADDVPDALFGDETRVRQIIANIVNNAVKYTHGGSVEMRVSRVSHMGRDWLSVIVKDSGIGIRKEDIPKLFGKFERFDAERNRGIIGTGLGLSITKQLVDMMGGSLSVESEYGRGSSFTVRLPLVECSPGLAGGQPEGGARHVMAAPGTKVLVAEDSQINISVALGYLAKHGLKPDTAENGLEAVEMVRANNYDLVFMDHIMPEMNGVEAARFIRSLGGAIPEAADSRPLRERCVRYEGNLPRSRNERISLKAYQRVRAEQSAFGLAASGESFIVGRNCCASV